MKYYIAIDASGGKTDAVLIEQTGKVVKTIAGQSANPLDIGQVMACERICDCLTKLKSAVPRDGHLAGIFCSISAIHYFPTISQTIENIAIGTPCHFDGVVVPVLASVLGHEDGVALISGTGSYCCVKRNGQPNHYFGSSGYLLDIGGSAYTIAQQGLIAVLREHDGRGEKTLLTEEIEKHIGESVLDHLPVIYAGGREYIASFSPYVFQAWHKGDAIAEKIIKDNAACYKESLQKAYEMIGGPFKVALGGGVFRFFPEYVDLVKEDAPEGCEFILIDGPAVYGCALEALWADNEEVPADFHDNFMNTITLETA